MKPPVLILFGPTASGKTAILKTLFGDLSIPAEIISADSMQVYRGMDIGTAKPTPEEREKIPHHLIDIRNPDEQFNAGDFVRLAEASCLAASERGALPVVSGGTGFYLKNLVMGLSEAPPSNMEIRAKIREDLASRGAEALMEELAKADPVSAERIHVNDVYRLSRALEVYRISGKPLSSYNSPWTSAPRETAVGTAVGTDVKTAEKTAENDRPFRFLLIGLRRKREELYRRINERTAAMFRAGLPDEVRRLYKAGYSPSDPGLKAIGYREFFSEDFEAAAAGAWRLLDDLAGIEAFAAQNSRRYAKRQITFFASIPGVKWIDCGDDRDVADEIKRELENL